MRFRMLALIASFIAALALPVSVTSHGVMMVAKAVAVAVQADGDCLHPDHEDHAAGAVSTACCHAAGFVAIAVPFAEATAFFAAPAFGEILSEQLRPRQLAPPVPPPRAQA